MWTLTPARRLTIMILSAAVLAAGVGVTFLLLSGPSTPADLASYLPDKGGVLVYLDVAAMRRAGILAMLAGSKTAEDPEYKQFVEGAGFDYRHDLDTVAATFRASQAFFVLRGRFDWNKLHDYVGKRGGGCRGSYCSVDGATPGRRISFYRLRSNLMAMATSTDDMAAYQIAANASKISPFTPDSPVWIMAPSIVMKEADSLPAGLNSFAAALQKADRAIFSVSPAGDHLKVSVSVECDSPESASNLLVQLETTTNLLRRMLASERREANPGDLTGVLVAGAFHRDGRKVYGEWPIERVFIDAIAGGSK